MHFSCLSRLRAVIHERNARNVSLSNFLVSLASDCSRHSIVSVRTFCGCFAQKLVDSGLGASLWTV